MTPDEWSVLRTVSVGDDDARLGYDRLRRPDDEAEGRFWVDARDSVCVVAAHDDEIVLVEEYRPRLGETVLSCPVGAVEGDESLVEAAARELREETGYRADSLRLLETSYPVAWLRKRRGIVFASGLTPGDKATDDDEFTRVRRLPVDEALDAARHQPVTDWTLLPLLLSRYEGLV
ncbi:NUDIX hydrolase [Haloprofundus halophilus]|uniref:NUDIX hydrolase n=1 Tax=Haloprofundus halophilus TaxID=2283527 RepID=UPI000E43B2AA|nr:NUDIX hydrolase [Haloprofundus halophilus]